MKFKILLIITLVFVAVFGTVGVISNRSYKRNTMDDYIIALSQDFLADNFDGIDERIVEADYILKVRASEDAEFIFKGRHQKAEVVKVFSGNDISVGEQIYIFPTSSHIFDNNTINMGFVNDMIKGKEYLVFLQEQVGNAKSGERVFSTFETIFRTCFAYDDIKSEVVPEPDNEERQVSYKTVKDYELFTCSQRALDSFLALKKRMIEKYN